MELPGPKVTAQRANPCGWVRPCGTSPAREAGVCFEFDAGPPDIPSELLPPSPRPAPAAQVIELRSADGASFSAAVAVPEAATGCAVVVLPDVRGLYPFYI